MPVACYDEDMGNLQIKGVPEEMHAELKRRAAEAGVTLRDYVFDLIRRDLALPSKREWLRLLQSDPSTPDFDSAALIREIRDERMAELDARDDDRRRR